MKISSRRQTRYAVIGTRRRAYIHRLSFGRVFCCLVNDRAVQRINASTEQRYLDVQEIHRAK